MFFLFGSVMEGGCSGLLRYPASRVETYMQPTLNVFSIHSLLHGKSYPDRRGVPKK